MYFFKTKFVKNERIEGNFIENEAVLWDPSEGEIIRLNPVAASIWEACDKERTFAEIIESVQNKFEGDEKKIQKEVKHFLKKLLRQEIIKST